MQASTPTARRRSTSIAVAVSFASTILAADSAHALIPIPVGGHPKELDVFARVTLERGLVEPNENKASFQKANWEMFTVGGGYGVGDLGPLQDFSIRAELTGYHHLNSTRDFHKSIVIEVLIH